jgi:hypothetical protein
MIMSYLSKIEMSYTDAIIPFLKGRDYGRKGHFQNEPRGIKKIAYSQKSTR